MTSRTTSIFRWIWRINGVLLLGACLAGIVALLSLSRDMYVGVEDAPRAGVTTVAGTDLRAGSLTLRPFATVKGTSLLVAPLVGRLEPSMRSAMGYTGTESSFGSSVSFTYDGPIGPARNLLFFDITTRKAHWLLEGNEQYIAAVGYITDPPSDGCGIGAGPECAGNANTQGILLQIAQRAADGTFGATHRIAIASPDGRLMHTIATDADALLGSRKASPTTLLVFYSVKGVARVAEVDVIARRVLSDAVLEAKD